MDAEKPRLPHIRGLDGIRALSVVAVMGYHLGTTGGPTLLPGGFLGVDVFFVVSGFLITSLLLVEAEATGRISLVNFYVRRAKRLLPALYLLLAVVAIVGVGLVPEQITRLRGDVVAALVYLTNWWLIEQNSSYFGAAGDTPPLLNHLWSLAVEEQFYLAWPLVLIAVLVCLRRRARGVLLVLTLLAVAGSTALAIHLYDPFSDPSRVYFGTDTRALAPLVGALLAIVVRPWRFRLLASHTRLAAVEFAGIAALIGLGFVVAISSDDDSRLYQGGFLLVAVLAGIVVAAVSHPLSLLARVLHLAPLRWLGERSYGIYLWHWPVFVLVPTGPAAEAAKVVLTVVIAAVSYRLVEQPIRRGLTRRPRFVLVRVTGFAMVAIVLASAAGARLVTAVPPKLTAGPVDAGPAHNLGNLLTSPSPSAAPSIAPRRPWNTPLRVTVFGDSQGMTLMLNKPANLGTYLTATDATIEGCGILLAKVSSRSGERRNLGANCPNWQAEWARRAKQHRPQVALVMLGAWDVFDLTVGARKVRFGTADWDAIFTEALRRGIGELHAAGAQVALALLPCYRPVRKSAGFWPERGDDDRTRHVNALLRAAALADPERVAVIEPPVAFCTDPAVSKNLRYRWDGVHYYKSGAALYFTTVIPQLLAVPRPPG